MKRTDLIEGQTYLVNNSNDWASGGGYGASRRGTVASLAALVSTRSYVKDAPPVLVRTIDGPVRLSSVRAARAHDRVDSVLVKMLNPETGEPLEGRDRYRLIRTSEIRGVWDEVFPRVKAATEAKRAEDRARRDQQAQNEAAMNRLITRTRMLGIVWDEPGYSLNMGRANIGKATLAALVALAEKGAKA